MIPGRLYSSAAVVMSILLWTASPVDSAPTARSFNIETVKLSVNRIRYDAQRAVALWDTSLASSATDKAVARCNSGVPFLPEAGQSASESIIDAENPEEDPTEELANAIDSWVEEDGENRLQLVLFKTSFGCALVQCPAGTANADQKEYLIAICRYN